MSLLYADENFPLAAVVQLRGLGHDVLTAFEAGQANQKIPDPAVLAYAISGLHGFFRQSHPNNRHFGRRSVYLRSSDANSRPLA
jgi:hypothetical protein